MSKKIDINFIFVVSLILFSTITLTYKIYIDIIPLSRILGLFIVFAFLLLYLKYLKIKDLIFLMMVALVIFISIFAASDKMSGFEDSIYWGITTLILWKINDSNFSNNIKDYFLKTKKIGFYIAIINIILISIFLFLPNCYVTTWEGSFFKGFSYGVHPLCCGICITLVLILTCFPSDKYIIFKTLLFLVGSFAVLQSGARTYLVSIIILFIFFFKFHLNGRFNKYLLIPIILFIFLFILYKSNFVDKMLSASEGSQYSQGDFMHNFTSGRTTIWKLDLDYFNNSSVFDKIFGHGFDSIYELNENVYGASIWAHNDIVTCLITSGYLGTIIYLIPFVRILLNVNKKSYIMSLLLFTYLFFTMFFNGLYVYQHYLYSFVLLFIYIDYVQLDRIKSKNNYIEQNVYVLQEKS